MSASEAPVEPWSLDELFEFGMAFLEGQARHMSEADDHWESYVLATGTQNEDVRALHSLPLNCEPDERAELYEHGIGDMIRDLRSPLAMIIGNGFSALNRDAASSLGRETLFVFASDATAKRSSEALVTRFTDRPPEVGPWIDGSANATFGAVIDPIRLALLEVAQRSDGPPSSVSR